MTCTVATKVRRSEASRSEVPDNAMFSNSAGTVPQRETAQETRRQIENSSVIVEGEEVVAGKHGRLCYEVHLAHRRSGGSIRRPE
jgi:hypothetical protein